MRQPIKKTTNSWWKHGAYTISGTSPELWISPAPGSDLREYDPWKSYEEARRIKDYAPPYRSLISLMAKLQLPEIEFSGVMVKPPYHGVPIDFETLQVLILRSWQRHPLPLESLDRIAEWCSKWGLLGVLPHAASFIAARCEDSPRNPDHQTLHSKFNGTWISHESYSADTLDFHALLEYPREGRMQIQEWDHRRLAASFFPEALSPRPEAFPCPLPLSPKFWQQYREPVDQFIYYGLMLQRAVSSTSQPDDIATSLNSLIATTGQYVNVGGDGKLSYHHRWPSLISAFGQMLVQDLTQGYRVLECPGCDKPFVTDAYQSMYCGATCAERTRKRLLRQRQRDALELRAAGAPVREIAMKLNESMKQVRKWLGYRTASGGKNVKTTGK